MHSYLRFPLSILATSFLLTACDSNEPQVDPGDFSLEITGDVSLSLSGDASFGEGSFATPVLSFDDEDFEGDLFIYWVSARATGGAPSVPAEGRYALEDAANAEPGSLSPLSFYAYLVLFPDGEFYEFFSSDGEIVIQSSNEEEIRGTVSFGGENRGGLAGQVEVAGTFRALVR